MSAAAAAGVHADILVSGCGGGLDVLSACLVAKAAEARGHRVVLVSVRPVPGVCVREPVERLTSHVTLIDKDSRVEYPGRYAEPRLCALLGGGARVLLVSTHTLGEEDALDEDWKVRKKAAREDPGALREAMVYLAEHVLRKDGVLVSLDGGGDSLILQRGQSKTSDGSAGSTASEDHDPFAGGDAAFLAAVRAPFPCRVVHAVAAEGLDIDRESFFANLKWFGARELYFGGLDLLTGATNETWDEVGAKSVGQWLAFSGEVRDEFLALATQLLVLTNEHAKAYTAERATQGAPCSRYPSMTGTVLYHALCGSYGQQRTFVRWEPQGGPLVEPAHSWIYFVDGASIHSEKLARAAL